jgi:hypothetical protein
LTVTDLAGNTTTLSFSLWNCASVDVPELECSALIDLYTTTNGDSRKNKSKWINNGDTTPDTVCDWQGIGCTAGRVSTINLQYNNLRGTLAHSFGNLT